MVVLFLKLLLAHILGDFVLQTNTMVEKRKSHIGYLFLHILIHAALLSVLFINYIKWFWVFVVFISISHLAIDSLKIWLEKKYLCKPVLLFVADQFLHLIVLASVVLYVYNVSVLTVLIAVSTIDNLLYLLAFLLIAVVSPVFLKVFFSRWNTEGDFKVKQKSTLIDAGMLIGIMERLIIVLFIQVGFLSGIGFLLAAKSIFRFGDLTNAKDTKFTEYVLVGTFASFLIAIVVGYLLRLGLKAV